MFVYREKPAKFAFVLGNSQYQYASPLTNPANDIEAIGRELNRIGFTVRSYSDLDRPNTLARFEAFLEEAGDCHSMVLYYSGHGIQLADNGKITNYIVPINFTFDTLDPAASLVSVQEIVGLMKRAETKLIFLDCCRDTGGLELTLRPARVAAGGTVVGGMAFGDEQTRSIGPVTSLALRREKLADNTFMAFAADPGDVAGDGDGSLSPFTSAVVRYVGARGLEAFDLAQHIAKDVRAETDNQQVPWTNANLAQPYYFCPSDMRPVIALGLAGAASGLITGLFAFNYGKCGGAFLEAPTLVDFTVNWWICFTSLPMGLALGWAAWLWGKRDSALAVKVCLLYFLLTVLGRYLFNDIGGLGNLHQSAMRDAFGQIFMTQSGESGLWQILGVIRRLLSVVFFDVTQRGSNVRQMLLLVLFATAYSGAVTILCSHVFLPSMRDLTRLAMGALLGTAATVFYGLFLLLQPYLFADCSLTSQTRQELCVLAFVALWQGMLGANAGWDYYAHVPKFEERPRPLTLVWWRWLRGKAEDAVPGRLVIGKRPSPAVQQAKGGPP